MLALLNSRTAAVGTTAILIAFGIGWTVNGWRLTSKIDAMRATQAEAVAAAIAARESELADRFRAQLEAAQEREAALGSDLAAVRDRLDALRIRADAGPLVRTEFIEGDCRDTSPFSSRFVDMWNAPVGVRDDAGDAGRP